MLGHRDLTMEDYAAMLRRHVWLIAVPVLLGPILAFGVSVALPEQYTSTTLVLTEEQRIPESIVPPLATDTPAERLATFKERILSRTRLEPIIEKNKLYEADLQKLPMEDLVAKMREHIMVAPVQSTAAKTPQAQGFQIAFTYSDPHRAQAVCGQITSLFVEEFLLQQEKKINMTIEFLRTQLEAAKKKLDEQDAKLAAFKSRNSGQLPGQEDSNLKILMSKNAQLDAATLALNRAIQDKAYTESQLTMASGASGPQAGSNPQILEGQLGALQNRMGDLQAQYTDEHPDVKKLKADIEQLKVRIAKSTEAPKAPGTEPAQNVAVQSPAVQQLRSQLRLLEQIISEKTREQGLLQNDIHTLQARVQLSPAVEEEYKKLTRDSGTALGFYNDLLAKMTTAEMFRAMSIRQQGEQFQVVDPANLPAAPTFPNRPLFAAAGLGVGLALGIGITLLMELKDKAIRIERDVEFYLELPALAAVPVIGEKDKGRQLSFWKSRKLKPEEQKETIEV